MIFENTQNKWELSIGLEVHVQLQTKSKLFSCASTSFGGINNTQVSLIDVAMPGTLPILNQKCVDLTIKAGLALNCKINKISHFDVIASLLSYLQYLFQVKAHSSGFLRLHQ